MILPIVLLAILAKCTRSTSHVFCAMCIWDAIRGYWLEHTVQWDVIMV